MQVQVKHNGTSITGFVQAYEREHKICTGIGTLRVEVVRTINRTFDTWDEIDIHENGDFKCRYYISSVEDVVPKGVITLECQDISKRLVDYFIPDTYTIEEPSYSRYWIEKFLTEAGIDFTFNTSSPGNILSNNMQLGLQPAYEQILTLLQMSGWFIYFNQSEEAVIGPLDANLAVGNRSVGRDQILSISRISDDKMLRNRALVIGTFDPFTLSYASADVSVHTRWNYDHRDVRAVVISNHNIPNKGTAFRMANQILKEFARITIEKHITVAGAKNWNLGEALRVTSTVWRGKGLITTFGTSMSKQGLVTNVILDERCPRLFGFFDYGDYVYVGTFGDGIWKKHIKFDPTFYDFSSGLTNLNIVDLHINNGVFGSVAASGEIYWNLEDGSWNQLTLSGLVSSAENTVIESGAFVPMTFSGLMGRAVIVDKTANTVKFGIDTYSGMSYGDYFLNNYPSGILFSGVVASGYRSWIVEYDVMNGDYGGTAYPVSFSGDYNFRVIDLENDGINDYISVAGGAGSGVFVADGYDLGSHEALPALNNYDTNAIIPSPINNTISQIQVEHITASIKGGNSITFYDNAFTGDRNFVHIAQNGEIFRRRFSFDGSGVDMGSDFKADFFSSATVTNFSVLAIHKLEEEEDDVYRVYYHNSLNWNTDKKIYYKEWNVTTNTFGSEITVFTSTDTHTHLNGQQVGSPTARVDSIVLNGDLYFLYETFTSNGGNFGGGVHAPHEFWAYLVRINLESGQVLSSDNIYHLATIEWSSGNYEFFTDNVNYSVPASGGLPVYLNLSLFRDGDFAIKIIGWYQYGREGTVAKEHLLLGNASGITSDFELHNGTNFRIKTFNFSKTQLTKTEGLLVSSETPAVSNPGFATNGTTFIVQTSAPFHLKPSLIYPIYSRSQLYYIARDGSNYYACFPTTLQTAIQINGPSGYVLQHPYSNPSTYGDEIFWFMRDAAFDTFLAKTSSVLDVSGATIITVDINGFTTNRGYIVGGFFVHNVSTSTTTPITYIYFLGGDLAFPSYMVLQREGTEFNLIEQESYPIRLDISNNAPVLTVGSGEPDFVSNFVYDTILEQIIYASGNPIRVDDYRYTYLEMPYSGGMGITTSGMPAQTMGLYVTESGVYGGDVTTYSGGFSLLYEIPSGYAARIETSNFGLGGQYIFVTTSGDNPVFYQKDPEAFSFTSYDGLPDSRATIIRLDDRI